MPKKKKQHYVPKFYMKEFANEQGKISIYHIKDEKCVESVPYKDQCYKDYYYGSDGIWEEYLCDMEAKWGAVIKKILANDVLLDDDLKLIKQFALYQRQRTYAEGEFKEQERRDILVEYGKVLYAKKGWVFDEKAEKICKERAANESTPAENLEIATNFTKYMDDLGVLIITYTTKNELISSDVPVISINPFHKYTIGYGCMGLIIFFPVSRHKLVVIYDDKLYSRFQKYQYIDIDDESEVTNLNILQYISAEKIVFAYRKNELLKFNTQIKETRRNCREQSSVSALGPDNSKMISIGMRLTLYECELSFGRLPYQYKRIPFVCREAVPRKWDKGWEEKLNLKEQIMSKIIETNPQILKDIGLPKKELRRGYRRMATVAQIYWNSSTKY